MFVELVTISRDAFMAASIALDFMTRFSSDERVVKMCAHARDLMDRSKAENAA